MKQSVMFLLWVGLLSAVGYVGWKGLTSTGASVAYDKIVRDLDTDQTIIFTKPNGQPVYVRRVDIQN